MRQLIGLVIVAFALSLTRIASAGPIDDNKVLADWKLKAEQGNEFAEYQLGVIFREGNGVPQNYKEATKWFRKAAAQGNAASMFDLAAMYKGGQGVARDYVRAHMWWNLAAATGDQGAAALRDALAEHEMTRQQVQLAQEMATRCHDSHFKDCD